MFFTAAVGAARKINTELFELSGLPEKPGQNSTRLLPAVQVKPGPKRHNETHTTNQPCSSLHCFCAFIGGG